jgi:DNA polymerase
MDARRADRLRAMGIVRWRQRGAQEAAAAPAALQGDSVAGEPVEASRSGDAVDTVTSAAALGSLAVEVASCSRCELHQSRTQTVFGVGNPRARLMIIGEAPGADEDARGEPFVGRAGRLLNAMLLGIGLEREEVYIANILKCRPPRNRDPAAEEVAACSDYLTRQIGQVAPELLLAVGRIAAQNLLGVSTPIGKLRGRQYQHPGTDTPVLVTYHPAYLLRSPLEKRRAWEDLKQVAERLGLDPRGGAAVAR